ncbi:MAG: 3-phosphoshikimate 1-carboxyvinyltransferase, partial [Acidobacteriota bacterium]|nr:3-phosphoshikimate 1-carboxyvinyltransferase [Acidobacteriota bacterium]
LTLHGGQRVRSCSISCGASGTMLRFLTAALTTLDGEFVLDGVERLRERPLGELIQALRSLGARIECLGREGFAPLRITGGELAGGRVEIPAGISSQFVSALLMAATRATARLEIKARDPVSAPYLDVTKKVLRDWGAEIEEGGGGTLMVDPVELTGGRFVVEGDFSSACYLAAGAALLGGRLSLPGLDTRSAQGDRLFLDLLAAMGAKVEWRNGVLCVEGQGQLVALDRDMSGMPDQVPTVAALAPFARGTTRIRNVPHLRLKESDRLAAVAKGLRAVGAQVEELEDGLTIPGIWAEVEPACDEAVIDTFNDHRIAMSFAVLGLRRRHVSIASPRVVEKSYPSFWTDFSRCLETK